jgi:capsular polysaccharide transport system ATP-binding protein
MHAPSRPRLIHLVEVTKTFTGRDEPPKVVFWPTTISLPADRRLAILGGKGEGKSVLLQLLVRNEKPDLGKVIAPLRLSPVFNSDRLFHPGLSGFENVRYYARRFGVDEEQLVTAMDRFYPISRFLKILHGELTIRERRTMEATLAAAIAFDCYLLDDVGQLAADLVERHLAIAARRGAGVIFTTGSPRLAQQFADCAVVIQDRTLHPFCRIEEATRFYERN